MANINFPEFYKLLQQLITKRDSGIEPDKENFNRFLMTRYISFYPAPFMAAYVNEYLNRRYVSNFADKQGEAVQFSYMNTIIPQMPYNRIKYTKKKKSSITYENGLDEEELLRLAKFRSVGKQEILKEIEELKKHGKFDQSKDDQGHAD